MHQIVRKQATHKFWSRWIILGLWSFASLIAHAQAVSIDENTRQRARAYESLLLTAAQQYHLDPHLLWVIAYLESRFRPWAVSPKGARGMMQLMPATAARWGVQNPHEPAQAIPGAARYVQYLEQRFDGRVDLILAAYNAGETAVEAYRTGRVVRVGNKLINPFGLRTDGVLPYRETRAYVRTGLTLLRHLSADNARTNVVAPFNVQTALSIESEVFLSTPVIRKSISYAAAAVSSDSSTPTATIPRSILYQSR